MAVRCGSGSSNERSPNMSPARRTLSGISSPCSPDLTTRAVPDSNDKHGVGAIAFGDNHFAEAEAHWSKRRLHQPTNIGRHQFEQLDPAQIRRGRPASAGDQRCSCQFT